MKKNVSKIVSLVLAVAMCFCMGVTAFAAENNTISTAGGSGTTPVNLSTTKDGTIGGDPAATALSVTVPTSLPMAMAQDGAVTTATNCKITNNSYGAVRVKSVTIAGANGWTLTAFGDKTTLASEKVDSNKLGFAMSIGGGTQVKTDKSNAASQTLISAPATGCYMSGVGNTSANSVAVLYDAIVTPLSNAMTEATIANVVFVVEWDI